jgi:hypothetical protein
MLLIFFCLDDPKIAVDDSNGILYCPALCNFSTQSFPVRITKGGDLYKESLFYGLCGECSWRWLFVVERQRDEISERN